MIALVCAGVGTVLLMAAVVSGSRGVQRQHYRRRRLATADWLLIGTALVAPFALGVFTAVGNSSLAWYASPLNWPRFDVAVALAFVPLLAPLLRLPQGGPANSELVSPAPADALVGAA